MSHGSVNGRFGKALICTNGHLITPYIELQPAFKVKKCVDCSSDIVDSCLKCLSPIRGKFYSNVERCVSSNQFTGERTYGKSCIASRETYRIPLYCHDCGLPYPWTESRLESARILIADMNELTNEEQENFSDGLPDILVETPKTTLAATRIKKYLEKAKPTLREGFKRLFFDVAIEAAKRIIW